MVATTEAELVRQVQKGDKAAFQTLLGQHLGPVSHYVARMTGDAAMAEDISQEVFLRLWSNAGRYDPTRSRLTTWLHNIAHNLCVDHFRKAGRIVADNEIEAADEHQDPVAVAAGEDTLRALQQLPETQRSAIVLCYYQGFSNREAADLLDINVPALESLLARGRRKLKQILVESR